MFETTRLKLTGWYLAIIMAVSLLFSLLIYTGVNTEYKRFERIEEIVQERQLHGVPVPRAILQSRVDPEIINAARGRLISTLVFINLAVLGISGVAGYILAGRTLKPISDTVDELNRFISDASHELRTPLTSLRSEMEVGLLNKSLTVSEARKLIRSNLEEVIRMQHLSDNLLALTQYQNTQMSGNTFTQFKLDEPVYGALKSVKGIAGKTGIKLKNSVQNTPISGNRHLLQQVFTILLDNAIKYSHPHGLVLIDSVTKDKTVIVTVNDQGIGIGKKDLPHIFDRFYRADKSRSKQTEGFGLGLSIAKKIVQIHKGSIKVNSKLNRGTTVSVRLPRNTRP